VSFADAVRSALTNYVTFSGRARRSEYWWFVLFAGIAMVVALVIDGALGTQVVTVAAALALFLPGLGVSIRRLHDTGRSSGSLFIVLFPMVGLIGLIVFHVMDGDPNVNEYGPSPKRTPVRGGGFAVGPAV
jgi:uncharacterized membrane protein YhaH (DUF805 family)